MILSVTASEASKAQHRIPGSSGPREMWCIGGRLASPTGLRVLLIVALPRAGVRPLAGRVAAPSSRLGVGLFGNAAPSGW